MKISNQAWLSDTSTQALVQIFARANAELRFVGGCVRNAILGLPITDIDVATPLLPEQVMQMLEREGVRVIPTGIAHGTVTAIVNGMPFEITTLRKDVATDGRHAQVAFTDDLKEDASRRDFTMNALYVSPDGEVTDYFGGMEDARAGVVKFIGDAKTRIEEDALRILRFFRFYAHYGQGEVDATALAACTEKAEMLRTLSGERIQHEMVKLLAAPKVDTALQAMNSANIFTHVEICAPNLQYIKTLEEVEWEVGAMPTALVRLALMLRHPERSEGSSSTGAGSFAALRMTMVVRIRERWKLPNQAADHLEKLVSYPDQLHANLDNLSQKKLLRAWGWEVFRSSAVIRMAEDHAHHAAYEEMIELADHWKAPVFPVKGEDLIAIGYVQGVKLGAVLKELESQWEDSGYKLTPEQLIEAARHMGVRD